LGFFFFYPEVMLVSTSSIILIAFCMSPDIETEGRYISLGLCALVITLVMMLAQGCWHWFPWLAITATLAWSFAKRVEEVTEDDNTTQRPVSGQIMPIRSKELPYEEELEWISAEDVSMNLPYSCRRRIQHGKPKRLTYTRGYLEGPRNER
jgi:hypothetical protein